MARLYNLTKRHDKRMERHVCVERHKDSFTSEKNSGPRERVWGSGSLTKLNGLGVEESRCGLVRFPVSYRDSSEHR